MSKNEAAIQFQDISLERGETLILKGITDTIYKGKITALVGPSGAGKTTLLKLCNGLISPTNGEIIVDQHPITEFEPTTLRRQVGIVLQNAPMIRGSVFDNLALPIKLQRSNLHTEEVISMLNNVGLDESFLTRDAYELSGGQKQKVAIARTLMNRPKILLLDEITSALDPVSKGEIEQLIRKINKEYGVTIIWITHNLQQAKDIGDFIWVMMKGQLVESGDKSIFEHTKNSKVQQFFEGKF